MREQSGGPQDRQKRRRPEDKTSRVYGQQNVRQAEPRAGRAQKRGPSFRRASADICLFALGLSAALALVPGPVAGTTAAGTALAGFSLTGGGSGLPEPAEILTALLGQKFTEEAFNKDDGLFELLAGHSTGELSVVDYYEHKQYIRWFLHLGAGYRTITLSGAPGETRALSEGEIHLAREEMGLES